VTDLAADTLNGVAEITTFDLNAIQVGTITDQPWP